jgi:two-component system sensor histidine kinase YesM
LGKYFEFITYNNDDMITLAEEMRHTKMYVEIQNYRFSERMTVEMEELPDNCRAIMVPKLILQPVVENAYKYALERKRRDGRLHIGVRSLNGLVEISVEDNGDQLSDEEIERLSAELERAGDGTESTGILNVHRRLTLTFGEGCGLKVSRGALGGFKATLTFRGNGAEAAGEDQDEDRSPPTG